MEASQGQLLNAQNEIKVLQAQLKGAESEVSMLRKQADEIDEQSLSDVQSSKKLLSRAREAQNKLREAEVLCCSWIMLRILCSHR